MARKLIVELVGDASSLEKAFAKSTKSAKSFDKATDKVGKSSRRMGRSIVGLAGGFVGAAGLTTVVHAAFSEMADAQKVTAQTNAVLKSTGEAAHVTAGHVDELANSLLKKSGVDDEVIKSGENMLLTFTNIRNEAGKGNDVFDQATKTLLDMSTATGQDMTKAAVQLGKALNDPIKGIGALSRVGVTFTASQKQMIKHLVQTGHAMEAQKIILRELNREFGGSAEAAGKTLPGKLNILRETLLNLAGSIAEKLAPTITKLVDRLTKWLENSKNQKKVIDAVTTAANVLAGTLKVLATAFGIVSIAL